MPYALLDEDFHSNPKMLALGNDGVGLYARGLSYCAHYDTNGFIPHSWAFAAAERRRTLLARLVEQRAWRELAKGETFSTVDRAGNVIVVTADLERGYVVVDYLDYNPSSVERATASEKKAAAGRAGAKRRWGRGSRHSTPIAGAIADAMANGWQDDGTPRARPPSPKELTRAVPVSRPPATAPEDNGKALTDDQLGKGNFVPPALKAMP